MSALLYGRADLARAYLDSLLAHSSSTLGQAEVFSGRDGGFGRNLPPHATAAATALELVHALVAVEDGDTLVLGAGLAPDAWPSASIARAPTRWGVLQATFTRPEPNQWSVHWQGVRAPVRVHVPEGLRLARVLGPGVATSDGRWILAPSEAGGVEFATTPSAAKETS